MPNMNTPSQQSASDNSSNKRPLNMNELIDLFKHWDTRVSHQEILFVPLSVAGFPAVAAVWKDIKPPVIGVIAVASILAYLYHLFAIRRIAVFQFNIFNNLKKHSDDFGDIVNPKGVGVQRLRIVGLPLLSILWALMICVKFEESGSLISCTWWIGMGIALFLLMALTLYLWKHTTSAN